MDKELKTAPFFFIRKIEDLCAEARRENKQEHVHDYFSVVLIEKGEAIYATHWIEFPVRPQEVLFVNEKLMHRFNIADETEGFIIYFNKEFFIQNREFAASILKSHLFINPEFRSMLHLNDEVYNRFQLILKEMTREFSSENKYRNELLYHSLMQVLLESKRLAEELLMEDVAEEKNADSIRVLNFKQLVEENYMKVKEVSFYADQLNVQPSCLNAVTKKFTGITAGELIRNRIIEEAQKMAISTELNQKEIAWKLGFEDPAYFSRFFKKYAGLTITAFREQSIKKYKRSTV